jgi:hypothetical protein
MYRRLIGISDMAQHIRVMLPQFYNLPLELEQILKVFTGTSLRESCSTPQS